jgi:hypothetical protein
MSSTGIVPINGGSVILRTYLDESANNTYLLGQYDSASTTNMVLVTSTHGLLISTTTVTVSSVGTTSIFANTISTNQLFICTIYYSTFTSSQLNYHSTIVSNLATSTITFITMKGGSISTQQVTSMNLGVNQGTFSTIIAPSLIVSSANTNQLSMIDGTFSTLIGTNMTLSSLSTVLLSISSVFVGLISTAIISSITLQASTIVVDNASFFETLGDVLATSTLIAPYVVTSTIVFSTMVTSSLSTSYLVASSIYQLEGGFSTQIGSTVITSTFFTPALNVYDTQSICSMIGSSIAISTLTTSTLYGSNQFFSVLTGPSTTTTNMIATSMINSSIQFSTMYGSTATIPLIYASTLIFPTSYVDSTFSVSSIITTNTYTSSMITNSISVNTYYINQSVYGQTVKKDSIDVFTNVRMYATDAIARVDNTPSTSQTYTIGPTIPNLWIAGSNSNFFYATSTDGITWTNRTLNLFEQTYGIVWTGNLWVAVGGVGAPDSIATSIDGIDWTGRGKTLNSSFTSPTATIESASSVLVADFSGLLFITGNVGNGIIGYSFNGGISWTNISVTSGLNAANQIAWNGNRVLVVGSGNSNTISWSDSFSAGWNTVTNSNLFFQYANAVIWTGHRWVVGGTSAEGTASRILYSLDGVTWAASLSGNVVFNPGEFPNTASVYGFGWNGSMLVAVGNSITNTLAYSMDEGYTWIGLGKTIFTDTAYSVSWNGQMWVATGAGTNSTAYSYNGIYWYGGSTSILPNGGFCSAFNFRRPYYFNFNQDTFSPLVTNPGVSLPIIVPANSKLDIVSGPYYNSGYTNFSAAIQTNAI